MVCQTAKLNSLPNFLAIIMVPCYDDASSVLTMQKALIVVPWSKLMVNLTIVTHKTFHNVVNTCNLFPGNIAAGCSNKLAFCPLQCAATWWCCGSKFSCGSMIQFDRVEFVEICKYNSKQLSTLFIADNLWRCLLSRDSRDLCMKPLRWCLLKLVSISSSSATVSLPFTVNLWKGFLNVIVASC